MAKRFVKGIEVSPETLARDVIDRVGGGDGYAAGLMKIVIITLDTEGH